MNSVFQLLGADAFFWCAAVLVFGLCIGSFLNVCISRIPHSKSIILPASACPACGVRIRWFDNIPLLSWLLLRAKGRDCKQKIPVTYPAIELLTGILFLAVFYLYGFSWFTPTYWLAVFGLLLGTFIDINCLILPDRVTIGGMILFPMISTMFPALHGAATRLAGLTISLLGLTAGFGLFFAVRIIGGAVARREALGFGDVKLMGALGALLGWQAVLYITFFSALTGSVIGLILIAGGKKELQSRIPYGPYIALAALSWILGGFRLWDFYVSQTGF